MCVLFFLFPFHHSVHSLAWVSSVECVDWWSKIHVMKTHIWITKYTQTHKHLKTSKWCAHSNVINHIVWLECQISLEEIPMQIIILLLNLWFDCFIWKQIDIRALIVLTKFWHLTCSTFTIFCCEHNKWSTHTQSHMMVVLSLHVYLSLYVCECVCDAQYKLTAL